jgi:hypothetical protein
MRLSDGIPQFLTSTYNSFTATLIRSYAIILSPDQTRTTGLLHSLAILRTMAFESIVINISASKAMLLRSSVSKTERRSNHSGVKETDALLTTQRMSTSSQPDNAKLGVENAVRNDEWSVERTVSAVLRTLFARRGLQLD